MKFDESCISGKLDKYMGNIGIDPDVDASYL